MKDFIKIEFNINGISFENKFEFRETNSIGDLWSNVNQYVLETLFPRVIDYFRNKE